MVENDNGEPADTHFLANSAYIMTSNFNGHYYVVTLLAEVMNIDPILQWLMPPNRAHSNPKMPRFLSDRPRM